MSGPRGWHSRGYMVHFDSPFATQHVTFHLADSLPKDVLENLELRLRELKPEAAVRERRRRIERLLDAGFGSCVLRDPAIARMVEDCLLHFDGDRYRLLEWVVMPNHVHVMFQTLNGWEMGKVLDSWKKFTGRRIADKQIEVERRHRCRDWKPTAGEFPAWQREYWDRFVRDERHYAALVRYVRYNPVKARLVQAPEEWPWGSARHR